MKIDKNNVNMRNYFQIYEKLLNILVIYYVLLFLSCQYVIKLINFGDLKL